MFLVQHHISWGPKHRRSTFWAETMGFAYKRAKGTRYETVDEAEAIIAKLTEQNPTVTAYWNPKYLSVVRA